MSRLAWFNGIKVTASVVVCIYTAESFSQSSLPSVQIWLGKEPKLTANVNQARSEQGPCEAIWLLRVSSLLSEIFSLVKSSSPPPPPPATPEEFEHATITGHFGFVVDKDSGREIT